MFWYSTVSVFARIMGAIMIGVALLFLLTVVLQYFEGASNFGYIRSMLAVEKVVSTAVRDTIPTKIGWKDLTRWIIIAVASTLSSWCDALSTSAHNWEEYHRHKKNVDAMREQMHLSENEQLKTAKKGDREQLLEEFAQTKKKLDEMGRDLAFLAIDVVDSTGMKQGEERAIVEHDFKEYRRYVERALTTYGYLKSTWTPDGVMSCFATVDAAVQGAREVIRGLGKFNREIKCMRRDFAVRCGVNSGFVYFDESLPLEEVSDRVIDIAGHMQKNALPNSVCVAKPAIEPLNERRGFEPSGRTVDGYEVYEWNHT
ncbi:MAG: guanylate cyclase [Acidobacteria bacterium]|nr:MAG: guanylate cyclase [Acidobacteriota bacterium]